MALIVHLAIYALDAMTMDIHWILDLAIFLTIGPQTDHPTFCVNDTSEVNNLEA